MVEILQTPLTVLHVIACVFLILVILIQPGKSGGMGGLAGAGAQQVFGGRGAGNFLTKTTWITGTIFFATCVTLAYFSSSTDDSLQQRAAALQAQPKPAPPPSDRVPSDSTPSDSTPSNRGPSDNQ